MNCETVQGGAGTPNWCSPREENEVRYNFFIESGSVSVGLNKP